MNKKVWKEEVTKEKLILEWNFTLNFTLNTK